MTSKRRTHKTRALDRSLPPLYGDLTNWGLIQADSLAFMQVLPDASIDSVICDPPYALAFGGKAWDGAGDGQFLADPDGFQAFTETWAREVRRILKPGAYAVIFCAPRTFHRLVVGAENAGLEVRDQCLWVFASGVPKSRKYSGGRAVGLKPAYEPILIARAPLATEANGKSLTVQSNLDAFGTGAMNIDATRIARPDGEQPGYWPSHIALSHDPDCRSGRCRESCPVPQIDRLCPQGTQALSRLFYAAKASRKEREAGCEALEAVDAPVFVGKTTRPRRNSHSTVKPLELMQWLVRLVTPEGGVVFDPFAGSASTGCAAVLEGRQFIGIERESEYVPIARARLAHWTAEATREKSTREVRE